MDFTHCETDHIKCNICALMRASYNGNTLASQASAVGSIPIARSSMYSADWESNSALPCLHVKAIRYSVCNFSVLAKQASVVIFFRCYIGGLVGE